ncbi:MAG: metallophosphoesterase [Bdellovibrionales bacterium]
MKTKIILLLCFLIISNSMLRASAKGLDYYEIKSAEELLSNHESSEKADEFKIALIGDTEAGAGFGSVLKLIATEKANVVMINGDLGYGSSPDMWKGRLTSSIDTDSIAVIGTLGNHDVGSNTSKYVSIFDNLRTDKNGLKTACTGSVGVSEGHDIVAADEVCTFGNVSIVSNAIGQIFTKTYLENRLEAKLKIIPATNWKLVGYHFTLSSMNPGLKGDESSFRFFDLIRQYGAIGAQAHTHSAMASCPISSPFKSGSAIQCHPEFKSLEGRFVMPGTAVYVDSSLGGKEARNRGRCKNPAEGGCKHMVDLISSDGYTRVDGSKNTNFNRLGALFFVFNVGGDASKAYAYFKSIDGQTIFKFALVR